MRPYATTTADLGRIAAAECHDTTYQTASADGHETAVVGTVAWQHRKLAELRRLRAAVGLVEPDPGDVLTNTVGPGRSHR